MNSRLRAALTALLVCSCSIACSNPKTQKDAIEGYFATDITTDDTKRFRYSFLWEWARGGPRPTAGGRVRGSSNRGLTGAVNVGVSSRKSRGPRDTNMERVVETAEKQLAAEIERSGFCREGYIITDRVLAPEHSYLDGRCEEPATTRDLRDFANAK